VIGKQGETVSPLQNKTQHKKENTSKLIGGKKNMKGETERTNKKTQDVKSTLGTFIKKIEELQELIWRSVTDRDPYSFNKYFMYTGLHEIKNEIRKIIWELIIWKTEPVEVSRTRENTEIYLTFHAWCHCGLPLQPAIDPPRGTVFWNCFKCNPQYKPATGTRRQHFLKRCRKRLQRANNWNSSHHTWTLIQQDAK